MPEKETLERAAEDKAEGKSPSTQAGEFVRFWICRPTEVLSIMASGMKGFARIHI